MLKIASSLPMRRGEHGVENLTLCSSAHPARSPLYAIGFLHEEEPCEVALTCPRLLGCGSSSVSERSSESRAKLVAFGCEFSDEAELSALPRQYEISEPWFCL